MDWFDSEEERQFREGGKERLREQFAPYRDDESRKRLIEEARREIAVAHGGAAPFAFATDKSEFVFSIRPSLAGAVDAARARFGEPSLLIDVTAWFPDGSSYAIPWGFLCRFTTDADAWPSEWIGEGEARELQQELFHTR
jgi:hypothetical protein